MTARAGDVPDVRRTMLWLTGGTLAYLGGQWLISVLVLRIAGLGAAGDYGLALASSSVAYAVVLFGMRPFQISDTRGEYADRVYFASRVVTSGLAAAVVLVSLPFTADAARLWPVLLLFLGFRLTEGWFDVLHGVLQNANRMNLAGIALVARALLTLLAFVVPLWLTGDLTLAVGAMFGVSLLLLGLLEVRWSRPYWHGPHLRDAGGWQRVRSLLMACAPLLGAYLAYALINFLTRNAITHVWGRDLQGAYASIAAPLLLVPVLVSYLYTPFMPLLAEHHRAGRVRALLGLIARLLAAILALVTVGTAILWAWGGPLFGLVFGPAILNHLDLLLPMVAAVSATALVYFGNAVLTSVRRLSWVLYAAVVGVVVVAVTTDGLVRAHGPNGASFALVAGQGAQFLVVTVGIALALRRRAGT